MELCTNEMKGVSANSINSKLEAMLRDDPDLSPAVASLQLLLEFIEKDDYTTIQGMKDNLQHVISDLCTAKCSITCVRSACELFVRFATLTTLDGTIEECKHNMSTRGRAFLDKMRKARSKIASLASPFVQDRCTILTHSFSRAVRDTLFAAAEQNKYFHVFVTESAPDCSGRFLYEALVEKGISATLIVDAAVGYVLEKVKVVLLGAERVVESGGIINKIGTYTIGMCAKEKNLRVYVLAESFKFARQYPLNQRDLPNEQKYALDKLTGDTDLSKEHPMVDYTPPEYITLLFTDLGILTTSAVSDELIKLYL
uniref:Translation initiation factor eIF2B subunit alpha n=1 Tax=Amblyomma maculatum TaxID=34609 RepID=G3MQ58_AMBMU